MLPTRTLQIIVFVSLALTAQRQAASAEEQVEFSNGAIRLSGTLSFPAQSGRYPGIVLLHGSGCATRQDYEIFAKHFVSSGFAVLAYDKRGCGNSTGSWTTSSLEDLAQDAVAAVTYLKNQARVDSGKVGIWGVSQAGWIIPVVAAKTKVAFAIVITGGGTTPYDAELHAYTSAFEHAGLSAQERTQARNLLNQYFHYLRTGEDREKLLESIKQSSAKRWYSLLQLEKILPSEENRKNWKWVADFDPMAYMKQMKMPVLLLLGEQDQQCPTDFAAQKWREGLDAAGNKNFMIKIFSGASHALRKGVHHGPAASKEDFVSGYFESMSTWLTSVISPTSK